MYLELNTCRGTLSWGSKSSSASNAWGTSSLSPNTDGGTTSPSYLSGHISSGSGTRPSTAGSDKSHEPTANAWGPNSRPSSASGVLTSNQTSLASLRPRSAEPRPGSSQLSRFAEHSEHPVAWSAPGTAEKLVCSFHTFSQYQLYQSIFNLYHEKSMWSSNFNWFLNPIILTLQFVKHACFVLVSV